MKLNKEVSNMMHDMSLLITRPAKVYQPIRDIVHAVYNSFVEFDLEVELIPVETHGDLNNLINSGQYSHVISINTHDFLEAEKSFYLDRNPNTCLMTYNLEQTPIEGQNSSWASMRLSELGAYGPYFDYVISESTSKDQDIINMGFPVLNLNLPYHPCLDLDSVPTLEDKEYDIFFIGCGSERRQNLINDLIKEGLKIAPAPMPQSLDPKYKALMVKKSKLCLNVHFSDMEYFEKPRIMYDYFMHRGVVISEAIEYPEHFENIKHFFMAKYSNMVPMILMILNKYNEETVQTGVDAYNHFKETYHFSKLIPAFLNQLYEKEKKFGRL